MNYVPRIYANAQDFYLFLFGEGDTVNTRWYVLITTVMLAGMIISSCAPAAVATATQAQPAATQASTEAPAATQPSSATQAATQPANCAPNDPSFDPTSADVGTKSATIAMEQEPDNVFGLFSNMSFSAWISQMVTGGLGKWDDKNQFIPELAAEIPSTDNGGVSSDGLTITWHLKPCLFWSDGQPFTSKDIVFTWKAEVDPGNAVITRAGYDKIASIDTPDDQTAVIHFSQLYPAWPTLFTLGPNNFGQILPDRKSTRLNSSHGYISYAA